MVNQKLLEKELEGLTYNKEDFNCIKYTKDFFKNLFKKYNGFKMEKEFYCCHGLKYHCWVDVIEEGIFDYSLEQVKKEILSEEKQFKKYLYNGRKYGGNRLYVYEKDEECFVFIYLRDILKVDYNIWFDKIINKDVNYETK
ncbi:MAG: hypothetical protein J6D12_01760 [Peptostreptococcaceae bacterium]|nr:hypothetical protein [Peptostreptococcaceae bacterium]